MNTELNIQLADKFENRTGISPISVEKLDNRNVRVIVEYTDQIKKIANSSIEDTIHINGLEVMCCGVVLPENSKKGIDYKNKGYPLYVKEENL